MYLSASVQLDPGVTDPVKVSGLMKTGRFTSDAHVSG